MGDEPAAATQAAPETREVESPAEAAPAREVAQTRDWVPPTKEFAVFAQSLDGVRQQGAGEAPPPESAARPEPERAAGPPAETLSAPPPLPQVAVETPHAGETTPAFTGGGSDGVGADAEVEARRDVEAEAPDARGRVARVREETRARVGRMRDEAIVVLEETPDDSGLRFVVAAAALFVVFVVLLFLSTTVLR